MDNINRRAVLSLLSSYASQFATTLTSLVTKILLARLIAPDDLGLYAKALLVLMAGDVLVDLGVSQHIVRERRRPYGNLLMMRAAIAVVLFAAIQLYTARFQAWGSAFPPVMRAMAIVIVIKALSAVPALYLDRELLIQRSLLPELTRLGATGMLSVGLAFLGYGVWALVWGTVIGEAAFALGIWRAAAGRLPVEITLRHTVPLVRGGGYLFLIALMGFALQQGHVAILGTLLSDSQVGYYAMAATLVVLVSKVVETAVFRVIYPMFCEYTEDLESLGRVYRQTTLAVYAIEAPIYFYLLFNAPVVVPAVLGQKWAQAAVLVQALSIAGLVNPFSTFGNEVLRARKRDSVLTWSTVTGAVTIMVVGYVLTLRYGALGMAAASYIILGSVPTMVAVYRILRSDFRKLAGQLAVVYGISLAVSTAVGFGFASVPSVRALVAGLLVPACWYTFYRVYGDGVGERTLGALISRTPVTRPDPDPVQS